MKKIYSILAISIFLFYGCETDLDIDNVNRPDYNQVISNASDLEKIIIGGHKSIVTIDFSATALGFMLMSDQMTTTNAINGFYQFAQQPRLQYVNTPTSSVRLAASSCWGRAYKAIKAANHIIKWIEGEKNDFIVKGIDKSVEALASAYFIKGAAEGALARVYDKAYLVNWDSSIEELLKTRDISEISASSIVNYDRAIAVMTTATDSFNNTYFLENSMNKATFLQYINSYAARTLISSPRSKAEAKNLDYAKVLSYANNGFKADFYIPVVNQYIWYPSFMHLGSYRFPSTGAGYLQVDVKVQHLLDPNYLGINKDYPDTGILPKAVATDPRGDDYFEYNRSFGILRESRNRSLFSNYRIKRWDTNGFNAQNQPGFQVPIFLKAEIDYIRAEATLKSQGAVAAAAILNSSVRKTVGKITTGSTYEEVMKALHYEYAVELYLTGSAYLQWSFMKRNDLLQEGTPTMMPIPANQLEAIGISETYTFGGIKAVGTLGTASTKGWKDEKNYKE